jgi:hypothetical protein
VIGDKWVGEGEYRGRQSESEKADTDCDPDSDAEYIPKILLSKTLRDALDCVLKGHQFLPLCHSIPLEGLDFVDSLFRFHLCPI